MRKFPSIPYLHEVEIGDFLDKPLVFTIKMDGSNAMMNYEEVVARNGHDATHPSFDMLKQMHANSVARTLSHEIQVCGEWLYAKHSIHYYGDLALDGYFQVFGVYDGFYERYDAWNDVMWFAEHLGFSTVPVYEFAGAEYVMFHDNKKLLNAIQNVGEKVINNGHEGIVVRNAGDFIFNEDYFKMNTLKYVRPDHVQTDEHWSHQPIVRNELAN